MIRIDLNIGATIYDTKTGKYFGELETCAFLNRIYSLVRVFSEPEMQSVKFPDFISKNLTGECSEIKLSESRMSISSLELYNEFINTYK